MHHKPSGGPLRDYGPHPIAVDIRCLTQMNPNFRTALWTGTYLQVTLMCIPPGGEIGLEIHHDTDQFLRLECGCGLVEMGCNRTHLAYRAQVGPGSAIVVPAGTWHNVTNTGCQPLKLYSIYAPPHHPFGTVHPTKAIAEEMEKGY